MQWFALGAGLVDVVERGEGDPRCGADRGNTGLPAIVTSVRGRDLLGIVKLLRPATESGPGSRRRRTAWVIGPICDAPSRTGDEAEGTRYRGNSWHEHRDAVATAVPVPSPRSRPDLRVRCQWRCSRCPRWSGLPLPPLAHGRLCGQRPIGTGSQGRHRSACTHPDPGGLAAGGASGRAGGSRCGTPVSLDRRVRLRRAVSMSWRSERMPSKNMMSCSLKKTTGSIEGRPRSE